MRRLIAASSALAWATLTAIVLALAHRRPEESLANGSGPVLALQAAVGCALFAAGAIVLARRARPLAGSLLIASGLAFNAQALPVPDAGGTVLFTLALVLVRGRSATRGGSGARAWAASPAGGESSRVRRDRCGRGLGRPHPGRIVRPERRPGASAVPEISCSCTATHRSGRMCSIPAFVQASSRRSCSASRSSSTPLVARCGTGTSPPRTRVVRSRLPAPQRRSGTKPLLELRPRTTPSASRGSSSAVGLRSLPRHLWSSSRAHACRARESSTPCCARCRPPRSSASPSQRVPGIARSSWSSRGRSSPVDGDGNVVAPTSNGAVTTEVVQAGEVVAHLRHEELSASSGASSRRLSACGGARARAHLVARKAARPARRPDGFARAHRRGRRRRAATPRAEPPRRRAATTDRALGDARQRIRTSPPCSRRAARFSPRSTSCARSRTGSIRRR